MNFYLIYIKRIILFIPIFIIIMLEIIFRVKNINVRVIQFADLIC